MPDLDPSLREYAARLLVGTDLSADQALGVATGAVPSSGPSARAVRDGWNASDTISPATLDGDEGDAS